MKSQGADVNPAVPEKIHVSVEDATMQIEWRDRTRSNLPLDLLRRSCPCAVCESHRETSSSDLHVITPGQMAASAEIDRIQKVGRYAIQIVWKDGHDSGIYTFQFLRQLNG